MTADKRDGPKGRPRPFIALIRVICILLLCTWAMPQIAGAALADAGLWGVNVCIQAHYDRANLVCTRTDAVVTTAAFSAARLSITGRAGTNFTSNTLTLLLERRTGDGDVEMGRTSLDVGLADNVTALPLANAFAVIGVEPTVNTTYVIEVDETNGSQQVLLGTAVFVLRQPGGGTGQAVPSSGGQTLVVIKRFGAALRAYPSTTAPIEVILACGTQVTADVESQGWYRVQTADGATGWVGGLRVAPVDATPAYDCTGAVTYQIGEHVRTYVATGCLSLRSYPSRQAPYAYCVSNGHEYVIINGPIEVAGEDWFGVFSPSTGSGWSLAKSLYPAS